MVIRDRVLAGAAALALNGERLGVFGKFVGQQRDHELSPPVLPSGQATLVGSVLQLVVFVLGRRVRSLGHFDDAAPIGAPRRRVVERHRHRHAASIFRQAGDGGGLALVRHRRVRAEAEHDRGRRCWRRRRFGGRIRRRRIRRVGRVRRRVACLIDDLHGQRGRLQVPVAWRGAADRAAAFALDGQCFRAFFGPVRQDGQRQRRLPVVLRRQPNGIRRQAVVAAQGGRVGAAGDFQRAPPVAAGSRCIVQRHRHGYRSGVLRQARQLGARAAGRQVAIREAENDGRRVALRQDRAAPQERDHGQVARPSR